MARSQAPSVDYDYKTPFVYVLAFAAALVAFEPVFFLGQGSLPTGFIVCIAIVAFAIAGVWATRPPHNKLKIMGSLGLVVCLGAILSLTHVTVGQAQRYEALRHGLSTTGTLLGSTYHYNQCRVPSTCLDYIDVQYSFVVHGKTYTNHARAGENTSLFTMIQAQGNKHQAIAINYVASNPSISAPLSVVE